MDDLRTRLLAATVEAIGRQGMARMTLEDVARLAGVGRATVYRHVPGGRDQLIGEAVTWEVGRFLARLADHLAGASDLASRMEAALVFSHRAVQEHAVLQRVLETEPERLLPPLSETAPLVLAVVRDALVPMLEAEQLRAGVDPRDAADWLARHFLSFLAGGGRWDLDDPAEVRRLVRGELLAGLLADPTDGPAECERSPDQP